MTRGASMNRAAPLRSVLALTLLAGCHGVSTATPAALEEPAAEEPAALAGLDDAARAAVLRSPVPVLLLPEEHAAASVVTAGPGYYAVSARAGELTLSIHATDVEHARGDGRQAPPRAHEVRGRPALVLVNDGIRSVTWEEGRTSYVVEVECFRALEDERCVEERFVLALAESLVALSRQVSP